MTINEKLTMIGLIFSQMLITKTAFLKLLYIFKNIEMVWFNFSKFLYSTAVVKLNFFLAKYLVIFKQTTT